MSEFGVSIDSTMEPAEALRKMSRDILIVSVPDTADLLYDLISTLRLELRPRLFITCGCPRSRLARLPKGVSVLHISETYTSGQIVPEILYGLIHDMPLHEAFKSARKSAERWKRMDALTLFTNPTANHDLRITDGLRELRREAAKLQVSFAQPLQSPGARDITEVSQVLSLHSHNLTRIQQGIDTAFNSSVEFSLETRGLKPLVHAESSIRDAGMAAEMIGADLTRLFTDQEFRNRLIVQQRRTVDVGLERLDTDVFLSAVESGRTLQAGARYQLRVHIGNRLSGSLVQGPIPSIDPLLHDPSKADGYELEIAVQRKEFALLSDPTQPAYLPRLGGTEPVYFTILAPHQYGPATLRICVYYRNQLLQSFLLKSEISSFEESRADHTTYVELEYSRTERFTNLDNLQPRALSIAANSGLSGTHELFIKGKKVGAVPLGDKAFADAMDEIRGILLEATVDPKDTSAPRVYPPSQTGNPAPEEVAEVLRKLADKGHELYTGFFRSARSSSELLRSLGNLSKTSAETIQVVRLYERFVFPWVLLYDFEKPESGLGDVCLGSVQDATGKTQPCAHGPRDKVYCINGFWGIRHRVEEFIAATGQNGDSVKTISPLPGGELVRMALDCLVPGAQQLSEDLQAKLGAAAVLGPIDSQELIKLLWQEPPRRPAVLLVLGHLETDEPQFKNEPKGQRIVLIPQKSWLTEESISNEFNAAAKAWEPPRSLVLLMACGSATTNLDRMNDFVLALNAAGAGAIVGSECIVFSDFACEFAKYLTLRLWTHDAGQATTLGQAMTEFRVQKLKSGNPLGFVFRSIGDADLTLQL